MSTKMDMVTIVIVNYKSLTTYLIFCIFRELFEQSILRPCVVKFSVDLEVIIEAVCGDRC